MVGLLLPGNTNKPFGFYGMACHYPTGFLLLGKVEKWTVVKFKSGLSETPLAGR